VSRVATRVAACLVLASFTLTSGCSVLFVRPAKRKGPGRYEPARCTSNRWAPALDVSLSALQFAGASVAFAQNNDDYEGATSSRKTDVGAGVAMALLFAGSAWYGFAATGTCRTAMKQLAAQQAEDDEDDDDDDDEP
jgi:hypothetical protein